MIIAIPDHPIQNLRLRISGGTAQRSGRTPLAPVIFQAGALFTQTVTNSLADSISYITPISLPFSFCFFFSFWRLKVRNRKSRWRLQGDSGLELPALNPFVPQDLQLFARTMTRYDQIWPDMTRYDQIVGCPSCPVISCDIGEIATMTRTSGTRFPAEATMPTLLLYRNCENIWLKALVASRCK